MEIDDVLSFVTKILSPDIANNEDDEFISKFLKRLRISDNAFSQRLLICIGIDLKVYEKEFPGGIELECLVENYRTVVRNTRQVSSPGSFASATIEPHWEFALSIKEFGFIACKPNIKAKTKADYVRVLNFDSYYNFVLPQNKASNPTIPYDIEKRHNRERFYEDFTEFGEHRELDISVLTSGTGWVFATDKAELEKEINQQDIFTILDRIGYYAGELPADPKRNKYIYLQYPDGFAEDMLQPTALIGDWGRKNFQGEWVKGNEFFLSFKKENDWGKTFPVTGSAQGIKERAHLQFAHPPDRPYPFKAADLTELKNEIPKAPDEVIIIEAMNRFISAC